jgi:PKHD-type hydroxylase
MLLRVPQVLTLNEVLHCRQVLLRAEWADGAITAGSQSTQVKQNLQLPETSIAAREVREVILSALKRNALFFSAALPRRIFPPLFNRYEGERNAFGNHIDNAIRTSTATGAWIRTDLSVTLFLTDPNDYDGGELVVEDTFGTSPIKLPAGDLILYPSSSVHRVEPVTRGARMASFFWIESMVREDERRRVLFDMDMSILNLRKSYGDTDAVVRLTGCYHNLLRMWADA